MPTLGKITLMQKMNNNDFMAQWDPSQCSDLYGSDMNESALADWVEFNALVTSDRYSWSSLIDAMKDSGVQESRSPRLHTPDGCSDDINVFETVHEIISFRGQYLESSYPFRFDNLDRLVLKDNFSISSSPYILFLTISLLKGWIYPNDNAILKPVADCFEHAVHKAIQSAGFSSSVIGTSSGMGNFKTKLENAAKAIGLSAFADNGTYSRFANDDGVDVIGGYIWRDGRKGEILCLIQAACGKTDNLPNKLYSIHSRNWMDYFAEKSLPYAIIAVPYHLSDDVVERLLVGQDNFTYLDRIRLVHLFGNYPICFNNPNAKSYLTNLMHRGRADLHIDF